MNAPLPDDEWAEYVANAQAFAGVSLQVAVPAMIAHVQLFNPVGSGVRLRIQNLQPMAVFSIAINTNIRRHDLPLATFTPFSGPENLLGGGAAPAGELRQDSLVANTGAPWWLILSAGNTRKNYPPKALDWGHDLLPGQGIVLQSAPGGFIVCGFMWAEEPL